MGLLNHIGVNVSNLERSIDFYTRLGIQQPPAEWVFPIDGDWLSKLVREENAEIRVAFLPVNGDVVLELLEYQAPQGAKSNTKPNRDAGAMHIALNVDDVDEVYNRLKGEIEFNSEPQTVEMAPWAGNRVVYLNDPDGTPVELVQTV